MPIVQALSGEPFGLSANLLRTGAVLLGDPDERAIWALRSASRCNQLVRVLWLDLDARRDPNAAPPSGCGGRRGGLL